MNNPHYFLYIGLLLAVVIGGGTLFIRWCDSRKPAMATVDDTINPPAAPAPMKLVSPAPVRPAKPYVPGGPFDMRRVPTGHGKRWRSCHHA